MQSIKCGRYGSIGAKAASGVFVLALAALPVRADIGSSNEAVNKAGMQRMITQRVLKDYALIGMNNTFGNPKEDLVEMIKIFDRNLKDLQGYIKDANVRSSLEKEAKLWAPIKKTLQAKPDKSKAAALQRSLDALLKSASEATALIEKSAGGGSAEIVNIAGRQRMLSQRMAALYMLKVWGIGDPEFERKLLQAMDEFEAAQKKLASSPMNTDAISAHLAKSARAYRFFEMMGKSKSKKYVPSLINRSANKILENMNAATKLYANR